MAVLKYKNSNGEYVAITNYQVQPITPVQTTGTSLTDVMSQKAVSDELELKESKADFNDDVAKAISGNPGVKEALADVISTNPDVSGAVDSAIDNKLNDYYNKEEINLYSGDVDTKLTNLDNKFSGYTTTGDFISYSSETKQYIDSADSALTQNISNVESSLTQTINSVSGDIVTELHENYITSGNTEKLINTIVYGTENPTPEQTSGNVYSAVTELTTELGTVSGNLDSVSAVVKTSVTSAKTKDDGLTIEYYNQGTALPFTTKIDAVKKSDFEFYSGNVENSLSSITNNVNAISGAVDTINENFETTVLNVLSENTGNTALTDSINTIVDEFIYRGEEHDDDDRIITSRNFSGSPLDDYYVNEAEVTTKIADALASDSAVTEAAIKAVQDAIESGDTTIYSSITKIVDEKTSGDVSSAVTATDGLTIKYYNEDRHLFDTKIEAVSTTAFNTYSGNVNNSLTSITNNINSISGDVTAVSGAVKDINDNLDDKISNVIESSTTINNIESHVDTISGDVITISGDVINISGDVVTISATVDTMNEKLNGVAEGATKVEYSGATDTGTLMGILKINGVDNKLFYTAQAIVESAATANYATNAGSAATAAFAESVAASAITDNASVSAAVETIIADDLKNYSSATEISTALNDKANNSDLTAHTSNSGIHLTSLEKANIDALANSISAVSAISSSDIERWNQTAVEGHVHANLDVLSGISANDVANWNEVSGKVDTTAFTAYTASTNVVDNTEKANLDALSTNIATISAINSTDVSNWNAAYTSAHSHTNKSNLDSITANVGTMAYENKTSYSSATEVSNALTGKQDTLVSGTNIKTINNTSILGDGNITIQGGGGISSVSLESGTNNGTLKLTVDGNSTDNIAVKGLGGAAYMNTGTTANTVAAGNHTHSAYATTGDLSTVSSTASAAKTVTDFYESASTISITSRGSIPVSNRLVIMTGATDTANGYNNIALSGALLAGREIHVIVIGDDNVVITFPNSDPYVAVTASATIANGYCEFNIISDGSKYYVRGA